MTATQQPTLAEILREVKAMRAETSKAIQLLTGLAIRKESRSTQAKKMKVSRSTLWRREQVAKQKAMLEGRI